MAGRRSRRGGRTSAAKADDAKETVTDVERHKMELDSLKESDPEFAEYLKEAAPGLLEFGDDEDDEGDLGDIDEELKEEDEGDEEGAGVGDLTAAAANKGASAGAQQKKAGAGERTTLTEALVEQMMEGCRKRSSMLHKLLSAYRSACHIADDDPSTSSTNGRRKKSKKGEGGDGGEEGEEKAKRGPRLAYRIQSSSVFNDLVTFCLTNMHHVLKTSRVEARKLKLYARSFLESTTHLVASLASTAGEGSETAMIEFVLKCVAGNYAEFVVSEHPAVARRLLKVLISLWSSSTTPTVALRLLSFHAVYQLCLATKDGKGPLALCLRALYLAYVRNSHFNTAVVNTLMRNCIVELARINPEVSYQTAFTYIKQLAAHLRSCLQSVSDKTSKKDKKGKKGAQRNGDGVHNWQFANAVELWSDVIAGTSDMPLVQRLRYPLIQLLTGVIDASQSVRHLPLVLRLVRLELKIAEATGTFVNPSVTLLHLLELKEVKSEKGSGSSGKGGKPDKEKRLKPLDLSGTLTVMKQYRGSEEFKEAVLNAVYEILMHWLSLNSYSISFPELALPIVVFLKKAIKGGGRSNGSGQRLLGGLLDKTLENVDFVNAKRTAVEFGPRDFEQAASFLATEKAKAGGSSPLHQAWLRHQAQHDRVSRMKAQTERKEDSKEHDEEDYDAEEDDDEDDEDDGDGDGEGLRPEADDQGSDDMDWDLPQEEENDHQDADDEEDDEAAPKTHQKRSRPFGKRKAPRKNA